MNHPDDFVALTWPTGRVNVRVGGRSFPTWPPAEEVEFMGTKFKQTRRSQITDEQIAGMTHVARGAEFVAVGEVSLALHVLGTGKENGFQSVLDESGKI